MSSLSNGLSLSEYSHGVGLCQVVAGGSLGYREPEAGDVVRLKDEAVVIVVKVIVVRVDVYEGEVQHFEGNDGESHKGLRAGSRLQFRRNNIQSCN
jgi:hypothetical protein